jgi:hypothetical protein
MSGVDGAFLAMLAAMGVMFVVGWIRIEYTNRRK